MYASVRHRCLDDNLNSFHRISFFFFFFFLGGGGGGGGGGGQDLGWD